MFAVARAEETAAVARLRASAGRGVHWVLLDSAEPPMRTVAASQYADDALWSAHRARKAVPERMRTSCRGR
jgi:hypothetical protein